MPEHDQQILWPTGQAASDKLLQRLAKLTSAVQPVSNDCRQLDCANAIAAIATEIDETVLPRTLIFENDRGEKLGLEVASRRILSVSLLELNADIDNGTALIDHAFFDADDPLCQTLYKAFITFEHDISSLVVRTNIKPEAHSFSNIGIAVSSLQNAPNSESEISVNEITDLEYAKFIETLRSIASTFVCTDFGGITESWGDEFEVKRLELLAKEELDQNEDPQSSSQSAPAQMAIWGDNMQSGRAVSCISLASQMIFAIVPSTQVPVLIGAWEKVAGGTVGPATNSETGCG